MDNKDFGNSLVIGSMMELDHLYIGHMYSNKDADNMVDTLDYFEMIHQYQSH